MKDRQLNLKNENIQSIFDEIVIEFIQGDYHTKDEAIQAFKTRSQAIYPELFSSDTGK
jgi:transposase